MKKLNLESFGVLEMNAEEVNELNGGALWGIVKEVAGAIIDSTTDFIRGVGEGYNDARINRIINDSPKIA